MHESDAWVSMKSAYRHALENSCQQLFSRDGGLTPDHNAGFEKKAPGSIPCGAFLSCDRAHEHLERHHVVLRVTHHEGLLRLNNLSFRHFSGVSHSSGIGDG